MFLEIAFSAKADLISRLDGQAVYDSGFNITWLANVNCRAGYSFDDAGPNDTAHVTGRTGIMLFRLSDCQLGSVITHRFLPASLAW